MLLNVYFVPVSCRRAAGNNERVGGHDWPAVRQRRFPGGRRGAARRSVEGLEKQSLGGGEGCWGLSETQHVASESDSLSLTPLFSVKLPF